MSLELSSGTAIPLSLIDPAFLGKFLGQFGYANMLPEMLDNRESRWPGMEDPQQIMS